MGVIDKAMHVLPPRAAQQGLYATSTVCATIDTRLIGPQAEAQDSAPLRGTPGAPGKWVTVSAIGADCYVAFATASATVASLTATTTGTNQANTAQPIFQNTSRDFDLEVIFPNGIGIAQTGDIFMGYVTASGTGYVHLSISSNR